MNIRNMYSFPLYKQKLLYSFQHEKWKRLTKNKKILFLGPWLGEVGPEVQYWIPFLQKLYHREFFHGRKLIIISRGGTENWYSHISGNYVDIFDHFSLTQYQKIRSQVLHSTQKQIIIHPAETKIIKQIAESQKITDYAIIHPSLMWKEVISWLQNKKSTDDILNLLEFQRIDQFSNKYQEYVDRLKLPSGFIAIKFYTSNVFKNTPSITQELTHLLKYLSQKHFLVFLQHKYRLDDHNNFHLNRINNSLNLESQFPLGMNLGIQTEIIKRSAGFIGTNGGFSILPALMKKPTLTFYTTTLEDYFILYNKHEMITRKLNEVLNDNNYALIHLNIWKNFLNKLFIS